MKPSFSLLELILVIIVLAILSSYVVIGSKDSITLSNQTKIKSDIALIRSSISKLKASRVLLNDSSSFILDNARANIVGEELFKNILSPAFISTNEYEKEIAKWIKTSQNGYKIYLSDNKFLEFKFNKNAFICKSDKFLCKEYE